MDRGNSYSEKDLVPIMEEVIESGGSCRLKVTGTSMTPTLRHLKDSVILVSPQKRRPKKNEIVFIKRDTGKHVLHRVRKILDDNSFVMNGDAQQWTEIVRFDQVIGVVEFFYRGDKEISCDSKIYKIYVKLWCFFKPVRPYIFKCRNLIRKVIK